MLVEKRQLVPKLRLLYYLNRRDFVGLSQRTIVKLELGIDEIESDTTEFQTLSRELIQEHLATLKGFNAKESLTIKSDSDLSKIVKDTDYLEITKEGRKLVYPLAIGDKSLTVSLWLGLAMVVLVSVLLLTKTIPVWDGLINLFWVAFASYWVYLYLGRRKLLERFRNT
jgi:hypothetical protein